MTVQLAEFGEKAESLAKNRPLNVTPDDYVVVHWSGLCEALEPREPAVRGGTCVCVCRTAVCGKVAGSR